MNGEPAAMPIWVLVVVGCLIAGDVVLRLRRRRSKQAWPRRFRGAPLEAAAALAWVGLGPGTIGLRIATAAASLVLMTLSECWLHGSGGALAAYRRALRRNAGPALPGQHPSRALGWALCSFALATIALLTIIVTQVLMHRR